MIRIPMHAAAMAVTIVSVLCAPQAFSQEEPAAAASEPSCSDCHDGENGLERPGPPHLLLQNSVHNEHECADCHTTISMDEIDAESSTPHGLAVPLVNCGDCHEDEAAEYVKHGQLKVGEDPDLPRCSSCHGTHEILPSSDRQSHVHPINLPSTCRACHTDVNLVEKHEFLRDAPIRLYESSVHGKASIKGLYVAATCNDCHSAVDASGKRTAHRVLSPSDAESTINHFNIPDTCGQCHPAITKDYLEGIHGQLMLRGQVDSPVCTHCHGEHGIISPSDPNSPVSAARVAEATCTPCHESEALNEKYGLPAGRLRSWVDSYHGLKSKAGDVHVANCASCHGAHRILPHTDPSSSIHPENLRNTCGECHPGISSELASTPIHDPARSIRHGWPAIVRTLYLWLIGLTIGGMLLHSGADFLRYIKIMRSKPYVPRMTTNETIQHWILMVSFIVLVVSGFSLTFSESWWVQIIFGWGGGKGFEFRGDVHRIAAVLFSVCCAWHILFLFTRRGRRMLGDMILSWNDLRDIRDNVLYFLGRRADRPRFARFSYMEKTEYWALVWGAIIMSVTGVLLWFDNFFVTSFSLPTGFLDIMLIVHYYEAWLATLAIFVWHGYSTVFSPHVYPMNPAWINGRMPREMYAHEHPEGPLMQARVMRTVEEVDDVYEERVDDEVPDEPTGGASKPGQDD